MQITLKKDLLAFLHHQTKLNLNQIGTLLGLEESSVFKAMKKHRINIFFVQDDSETSLTLNAGDKEYGTETKPGPVNFNNSNNKAKRLDPKVKEKFMTPGFLDSEIDKSSKSDVAKKYGITITTINYYLSRGNKEQKPKVQSKGISPEPAVSAPTIRFAPKVILRKQGEREERASSL